MPYQAVNRALNIRRVIEFYHGKFINNRAKCPFHTDKSPSMTVHEGKQIFKCHSCGVGGDSVYFVKKLFSISNSEAVKRLNQDFRLGLEINKPDITAIRSKKAEQDAREQRNKAIEVLLFDNFIRYRNLVWRSEPMSDAWVEGINNILQAEYMYDEFCKGTEEEKDEVVKRLGRNNRLEKGRFS